MERKRSLCTWLIPKMLSCSKRSKLCTSKGSGAPVGSSAHTELGAREGGEAWREYRTSDAKAGPRTRGFCFRSLGGMPEVSQSMQTLET